MANIVVIQANRLLEEPEFVSVTSAIIYRGRAFLARAGTGSIEWIPQDDQRIPLISSIPSCSPLGHSEDFQPDISVQVPGEKNNNGFNNLGRYGMVLEPGEAISLSIRDNEDPDIILKNLSLHGKNSINVQKKNAAIDKKYLFRSFNEQHPNISMDQFKKLLNLKVLGKYFLLFLIGVVFLSVGGLSINFLPFSKLEPTRIARDESAEFSQSPTTKISSPTFSPTPRASDFFVSVTEIEGAYTATLELPNGEIRQVNENSIIVDGSTINTSQGRLAFEISSRDKQIIADVILLPDSSLTFQGDGTQMIELRGGAVWINAPDNSLVIKTADSPSAELILSDGQIALDTRNVEQIIVICFSGTCLFRPHQEVNFISVPKGELYVLNKSFDLVLGKSKITEEMLVRMNELCGMCLSNVVLTEVEIIAPPSYTTTQKSTPNPSFTATQPEHTSTPIPQQPTNTRRPSHTPTITGTPTLTLTSQKTSQSTFTYTATSTKYFKPTFTVTSTKNPSPTPTMNSSVKDRSETHLGQLNLVSFPINCVTIIKPIFQR